jgi:triphosphoribosyl-dephospho-CoA synthase
LINTFPLDRKWPIPVAAELACTLEVSAFKAGNVHPHAAFDNMHFGHFVASSMAIRDVFANAASESVGRLVLDAVIATRTAAGCNTNLGTLLLLAPLAKAAATDDKLDLQDGVRRVLAELTQQDSELVYQAIRAAQPGGMGRRAEDDVSGPAPDCLIAAMRCVSGVDAVARQYTNDYQDIFERLLPWLQAELESSFGPLEAISRLQLRCLAHEPDGLIARKLGNPAAREIQQLARELLPSWEPQDAPVAELKVVQDFDRYLRSDGHRRNPGTTADLIAATLFVQLLTVDPGSTDV